MKLLDIVQFGEDYKYPDMDNYVTDKVTKPNNSIFIRKVIKPIRKPNKEIKVHKVMKRG